MRSNCRVFGLPGGRHASPGVDPFCRIKYALNRLMDTRQPDTRSPECVPFVKCFAPGPSPPPYSPFTQSESQSVISRVHEASAGLFAAIPTPCGPER